MTRNWRLDRRRRVMVAMKDHNGLYWTNEGEETETVEKKYKNKKPRHSPVCRRIDRFRFWFDLLAVDPHQLPDRVFQFKVDGCAVAAGRCLGPRLPPFPFPDDRPNPLETPLQLRAVADLLQVTPRIAQLMKNDLGLFVHLPSISGLAKPFETFFIENIFNCFSQTASTVTIRPFRIHYTVELNYVG